MKVLHIIPSLYMGGAQKLVISLLERSLDAIKPGLCCLYEQNYGPLENYLQKINIPVWFLGKKRGPDLRIPQRIMRVIQEFKPEVVHTHLHVLRYTIAIQIKQKILANVHTIHTEAQYEADFLNFLIQRYAFHRHIVQPVALSPRLSQGVRRHYGLTEVPYIYNGVDTQLFGSISHFEAKEKLLNELGTAMGNQVFLHVGSFSQQKNHKLLISAFKILCQRYPNSVLCLVGEGELRRLCEQQVAQMGLSRAVRFLGWREDIPNLMAAADVFVLSSNWEGIPLVVLEAMASGLPVIATDVGGVPELVRHGETGLLVPLGDVNALADAMFSLATNTIAKKAMGTFAQSLCRQQFDIKLTAANYQKLYEQLLQYKR